MLKAAPNLDVSELKEQLRQQNIDVTECIRMKGRGDLSYSYLISTSKETNIGDIKKIQSIDHLRVKWEIYRKKKTYAMCHRCQRFGHGSTNCNLQPRCVKCAGPHFTSNCQVKKTEETKAQCCNCNGEHPANYSKCPTLETYVDEKLKKSRKPHLQTLSNMAKINQRN